MGKYIVLLRGTVLFEEIVVWDDCRIGLYMGRVGLDLNKLTWGGNGMV